MFPMEEKLAEVLTAIPFNRLLGMRLDEINDSEITISFSMKNDLIGNFLHGILHGGVISSVLDMAGGVAVMVASIKRHEGKTLEEIALLLGKIGTINLHVDFLRPGKGEEFKATGYLVQAGNQVSFARMELFSKDILIATGSAAYSTK